MLKKRIVNAIIAQICLVIILVSYSYEAQSTENLPLLMKLWVDFGGTGRGRIDSNPWGIHCSYEGGACENTFDTATWVTLEVVPDEYSVFLGFGGNPDCVDGKVFMNDRVFCKAYFKLIKPLPNGGELYNTPSASELALEDIPVITVDELSLADLAQFSEDYDYTLPVISTNSSNVHSAPITNNVSKNDTTAETMTEESSNNLPQANEIPLSFMLYKEGETYRVSLPPGILNGKSYVAYENQNTLEEGESIQFVEAPQIELTITFEGDGHGIIKNSPEIGDDCDSSYKTCLYRVDFGLAVSFLGDNNNTPSSDYYFTAIPNEDSSFVGWEGDCYDKDVRFDSADSKSCIARFEKKRHMLSVDINGKGAVTIEGCNNNVTQCSLPESTIICTDLDVQNCDSYVIAEPTKGWQFIEWADDCAEGSFVMIADKSCKVYFKEILQRSKSPNSISTPDYDVLLDFDNQNPGPQSKDPSVVIYGDTAPTIDVTPRNSGLQSVVIYGDTAPTIDVTPRNSGLQSKDPFVAIYEDTVPLIFEPQSKDPSVVIYEDTAPTIDSNNQNPGLQSKDPSVVTYKDTALITLEAETEDYMLSPLLFYDKKNGRYYLLLPRGNKQRTTRNLEYIGH